LTDSICEASFGTVSGGYVLGSGNLRAASSQCAIEIIENAERNDAMGRLVNSPQGQLTNAPARELMTNLQNQLESALSPEIKKHTITVSPTRDGIVVSLKEAGFFDSGSAAIRPDTLSTIAHFIGVIRPYPVHIRIEGHTDNVPIHTARFDSNWELSTARATEMIKLFIAQFGIAPNRLSASGYGEYYPIASNDTPEGRAQNRRVDLVLLNPTAVVAPPLPRIPTVIPRLPRP
jgi:chemotaxis protein MotB